MEVAAHGNHHQRHGQRGTHPETTQHGHELRVLLFLRIGVGEGLVAAGVQGSNSDRQVSHGIEQLFINDILFVLGGKVRPNEKRKLGSVQADAFRLEGARQGHLGQEIDIGEQSDARSVFAGGMVGHPTDLAWGRSEYLKEKEE